MRELLLEQTFDTPEVKYDSEKNSLNFSGKSLPENVVKFYSPILQWIEEFCKENAKDVIVNFNLKYFNSASAKMILEVLKKLHHIKVNGKQVLVNWHYLAPDEDMKEEGKYFEEMSELTFKYIELQKRTS